MTKLRWFPLVAAGALSLLISLATALFAAAAPEAKPRPRVLHLPPGAEKAAKAIDRSSLEAPIRFLADDLLEGRAPATRGDEVARRYLETSLQLLGYQPGLPNGSWQQPFEIVGITSQMPKSWDFVPTAGGPPLSLAWWDEYVGVSGLQQESVSVSGAEVVFVGYGIQAPEYGWDDFKGMDLQGKVLLMLNNDPDWDPKLFEGVRRLYYGRWTYKYESAARQGAAGAIIIHTTPSAGYPWQVVQTSWGVEQFEIPAADEPRIKLATWTTEEAARKLVARGGQDLDALIAAAKKRDFKPVPLGLRTSLSLTTKLTRVQTANVLGVLPGSDPKLRHEVVLYTAHHDHLGVGEPDTTGDKIYNGAIDNAAGCAQLLAIAKAFTALPQRPKRSILFAFVAAEESGLLGSAYLAAHPPVPAGRIAADLNFDGGTVLGRTLDLGFIGLGKSSLDKVVGAIALRQERRLEGDKFPDRGHFYRSDQFSFARIGVPAIYLDNGAEVRGKPEGWGREQLEKWEDERYHQPSDEFDPSWNFDGMIEDAQVGFFAGLSIAEDPKLPVWNPGDEFEAARKAALAESGKQPATWP